MVEGLIGRKVGMTQTFDDQGNVVPVTMIKAGPCTVIHRKSKGEDGYSAVQMGLIEDNGPKKANKPSAGHCKQAEVPPVRVLREFRIDEKDELKPGDQVFVDMFTVGDKVDVVGTSKGKGFAGVVKRWGFHGGDKTHGSMFHRHPGSIGCSAYPSRVLKGKKMP
ncbi:MAG: 50S ribosomal protein L3, partial [Bacteroidota bacterium]